MSDRKCWNCGYEEDAIMVSLDVAGEKVLACKTCFNFFVVRNK